MAYLPPSERCEARYVYAQSKNQQCTSPFWYLREGRRACWTHFTAATVHWVEKQEPEVKDHP